MRYIPNVITCFRIFLSMLLLTRFPFSMPFYFIYALCGITDFLDGYLARAMRTTSPLGAFLDSIADMVFIFAALFMILPAISIPTWVGVWTIGVLCLRLCSLAIGYSRYHAFACLHTYANKSAGFLFFCFPLFYKLWGIEVTAYVTLLIATLSAIEELLINATRHTLNPNIKSILSK